MNCSATECILDNLQIKQFSTEASSKPLSDSFVVRLDLRESKKVSKAAKDQKNVRYCESDCRDRKIFQR